MHPFFSLLLLCYGTQATVSLFVAYGGLSMVTMTMKVTMMIPMKIYWGINLRALTKVNLKFKPMSLTFKKSSSKEEEGITTDA